MFNVGDWVYYNPSKQYRDPEKQARYICQVTSSVEASLVTAKFYTRARDGKADQFYGMFSFFPKDYSFASPAPSKEEQVSRKIKILWNKSKWVQQNKARAY